MSAAIKFHPVSQNSEKIITINLSSSSNRSCLTRRNIAIGSAIGIGIIAAAVTAYFLSTSNLFTGNALSANTTEASIGYSTGFSVNQSTLSLHNITQLVETEPDYYANCNSAFKAHLKTFETCGQTLCACIRNARDTFELHCLDYARNILKMPEECKEAGFRMQRCLEREC